MILARVVLLYIVDSVYFLTYCPVGIACNSIIFHSVLFTVLIYISTTIIAGIFAVIFSILFKGMYLAQDDDNEHTPSYITVGCASSLDGDTQQANSFLTEYPNGTIACTDQYDASHNEVLWTLNDVNGTFVQSDGGGVPDLSLSETIYSGVFETLIPENIFQEFYNANFAAVIVFAIALGVAAAKVLDRQQITSSDMTFMALMVELDQILTVIINWIILLTPVRISPIHKVWWCTCLLLLFTTFPFFDASLTNSLIHMLLTIYALLFPTLTQRTPIICTSCYTTDPIVCGLVVGRRGDWW